MAIVIPKRSQTSLYPLSRIKHTLPCSCLNWNRFETTIQIVLFFTGFLFAFGDANSLSLREGQHNDFKRLVLESLKDGELLSHRTIDPKSIELTLKGGICRDLASHPKMHSTLMKSWTVKKQDENRCVVRLNLHKNVYLKRSFVLRKTNKYPARFVFDFSTYQGQMKTPERLITDSSKQMNAFQDVPPEKPSYMKGIFIKKGVWFHPIILKKPFRPTIVIDPGHGGHDPGSVSCRGNFEKQVTLRAAKVMVSELKKVGRYHIVLTRQRDVFVPKRERFAIARESKADFLISVHADSHPMKKLRGLTIYTLSAKASDVEASRLAKQENKSDFLADLDFIENKNQDVSSVLIDIVQRGSKNTALKLAEKLHDCLRQKKVGKLMTLRSADLAVLKAPDTPSVLIELGYLSNSKDEKLVRKIQYQKKVAQALLDALDQYFKKS